MSEQPLLMVGLDGEMTGSGSRERGVVASQKYALIQIGLALPDGRMFRSDIGFDTWNEQPEAMAVNKFTYDRIKAGMRPDGVDRTAVSWLEEHLGIGVRRLHAVGWNVGSFDMPFVSQYLPSLFERFSYRSVDLNSIVFAMTETFDEYERLKSWAKGRAETDARRLFPDLDNHDAGFDALTALYSLKYLKETIYPDTIDDIIASENLRRGSPGPSQVI